MTMQTVIKRKVLIAASLLAAIGIGCFIGYQLQPPPERFVQVNAFGQWRGFEITGDRVRWAVACGTGQPIHWRPAEAPAIGLRYFTRESPLIYSHPSIGDFAKVDEFSDSQIGMAAANMQIMLKRWGTTKHEGERFVGCPTPNSV